jgi:hypothetical protein
MTTQSDKNQQGINDKDVTTFMGQTKNIEKTLDCDYGLQTSINGNTLKILPDV